MDYKGLTSEEAGRCLKQNGLNEIEEKKKSFWKKLIGLFASPINLMLLTASFLSLLDDKTFDFYLIFFLLFFNFFIAFWQERKADNAIDELRKKLSVEARVLRDGSWQRINSKNIVIRDIVELTVGDLVPADFKIIDSSNLSVNESVLTGESLPKDKHNGENIYSGSFITTGWARAETIATGKTTYFGKTLSIIEKTPKRSALEKDVLQISKILMVASLIAIAALTIVFITEKFSIRKLITLDLSLLIAGVPIALPTVMTLIISIGALELAGKKIIIRRLASLEDLANVNLFLTDKTGTLTKNEIIVEKIIAYGKHDEDEVVMMAYFNAFQYENNAIDNAIFKKSRELGINKKYNILKFIPADSTRKRATSIVEYDGNKSIVSAGAPQIIEELCKIDKNLKIKFEQDIKKAADLGYRALAVAVGDSLKEESMEMIGVLLLSDSLDSEAKEVISFMKNNGIEVKMLTGDNALIAQRVANDVGINGGVARKKELDNLTDDYKKLEGISVFSEILPEDKFKIVKQEKNNYTVAVTGDGVNDIPAIKIADIGIAVKNAVDALKSSADIVLLSSGIAVIKDAFIEARKIFERLYSYSVYRMSESFRLIITVLIIGIMYKNYPLMPIQLIILAFLNDVPIVSLAFDRVKYANQPKKINAKKRFALSSIFGIIGVLNSLILLLIATNFLHLSWSEIQTMYFLKLTVSGHMLIYVAHTKEKWFKFLPSKEVILATTLTQLFATLIAIYGIFMSAISIRLILFVWIWSFFWMQISEAMKGVQKTDLAL